MFSGHNQADCASSVVPVRVPRQAADFNDFQIFFGSPVFDISNVVQKLKIGKALVRRRPSGGGNVANPIRNRVRYGQPRGLAQSGRGTTAALSHVD